MQPGAVAPDVLRVEPLAGRRLRLTFADGLTGIVDLDRLVGDYDGVFGPLKNEAFFRRVSVDRDLGTIVWPNSADLAPDLLHAAALESAVGSRPEHPAS